MAKVGTFGEMVCMKRGDESEPVLVKSSCFGRGLMPVWYPRLRAIFVWGRCA